MIPQDQARQKFAAAPLDLRLAVVFSPAPSRAALTALFATYLEIHEIIVECRDPGVAEIKLRWWEQEIDALYAGQPRHPLTRALLPFKPALVHQRDTFMAMITGTRMDVTGTAFPDFEDVKRYCYRHSGALAELSAAVSGADSSEVLLAARLTGNSCRLAQIVTDGLQQALRGRLYFAAEDLRHHGVDRHISGGQHNDSGVLALLSDYAERARRTYRDAQAVLPAPGRPAVVPWLVLNRLAFERLKKFERRGFSLEASALELHPLGAAISAWRTARRYS